MYIDVKTTVWERITINEDVPVDELLECLKEPFPIDSVWDKYGSFCESDILYETSEEISVEENAGCATVELYTDTDKLLWKNGE